MNIVGDYVAKCVATSFTEGSSENTMYKKAASDWNQLGSHMYPAITVNNRTIRGRLTPDNIFEAVCASFSTEPKACRKWQSMNDVPVPDYQHPGINARTLGLIMLTLIIVNCIIIAIYRKYLQDEMQQEMKVTVTSAVSQYVALSNIPGMDGNKNNTTGSFDA
jgi:hypothetical protein